MSSKRSIDARRQKIQEINQQVESARADVEGLRQDKQEALDARTALERAKDIDPDVASEVSSRINEAVREIESKGQEVSDDLSKGNSELEVLREETDAEISETASQKSNIERVQGMMAQFGLDDAMSGAVDRLSAHETDLQALLEENIEAMRSLQEVSQQAASI